MIRLENDSVEQVVVMDGWMEKKETKRDTGKDMTIKVSPMESNSIFATSNTISSSQNIPEFMQHTDVDVSKVIYVGENILWLGKRRGRCISMWKRDPLENIDPFKILTTKEVDVDPNDVCLIGKNSACVGFTDGSLAVLNTEMDDLALVKRFPSVHDGCESRKVVSYEDGKVLSASTNGSLELVDIETGTSTTVFTGQSGIRSLCTTFGGQLVATVLEPITMLVPSEKALDSITALCSHPAQSNLVCFGTNYGIVGLIDVRNGKNAAVSSTYLVTEKSITQVMFHPTCSDNLLCSSTDGSILRLDASSVPMTSQTRTVKENVWLTGDLANQLRGEPIRRSSIFPISSFDCRGDSIVASSSTGFISSYEHLPFFPSSSKQVPPAPTNDPFLIPSSIDPFRNT
ncbi:unnamed protein product [Caenorhabditis angaria]|uniref:Uncharacterized protein n=1 Tax=Caenorhabditis angaria TaxID=860376 RepID=A0A9P1N5V4_9PELO|nr:unnamed protein product [Caenorhabditis angaria]